MHNYLYAAVGGSLSRPIKLLVVMKLIMILLTAAFLQVGHAANAQRVTLRRQNAPLEALLKELHTQTGYYFLANSQLYSLANPVTIELEDQPIETALDRIFRNQPLQYEIDDRTVYIRRKPEIRQQLTVRGSVQDSLGKPLPNATVKVMENGKTVFTSQDGQFTLMDVPVGALISISYVGYQSRVVPATGSDPVIVTLSATNARLAEVAIQTGYQTISPERVTGSYSRVEQVYVNDRMQTNLMDRLEGSVPGLFMTTDGVNIRGLSTVYGNQAPLYVVDGFPYEGNIGYLNPADIVNVTVLKDAAAASIYGTRAANGVITITTRKGSVGKLTANYNSNLFVSPLPDIDYLNLMNGQEMVDIQQELFNLGHRSYNDGIRRAAQPKAIEALYQHEQGQISTTELNQRLDYLRAQHNRTQVVDRMMHPELKQQHSFSVNGGSEINQFSASINYIGNRGYNRGGKNQQVNINLTDQVRITDWLQADAGIHTTLIGNASAPQSGFNYLLRYMPYEMLVDESGGRVAWNYMKSAYERNRLTDLGLLDETFNPLSEMENITSAYRSNYIRIQGGLRAKLLPGLNADLRYQTERGGSLNSSYYAQGAYSVRSMINNAAQVRDGEVILNVPLGGQLYETRGDSRSYTLRGQLNYDRAFGQRHQLTALAGSERRAVVSSYTNIHRMGYSDNNLNFMPVDAVTLADIRGTESLNSNFQYNYNANNRLGYAEDRYVSFYMNAGYTLDRRYNLTGSVRVDNSNLFGTDPRYRYLPLWSVGASWRLAEEQFVSDIAWIDNLTVRATFGLNGNVAKNVGPFLQAQTFYNIEATAWATQILNPPNRALRWEKTAVTNVGIDYAFLNGRISGSLDYYNRKSTDLLGEMETDPTNAFQTALINYGSLWNRGIELALNTENIRANNMRWTTRLNFSYNRNRMTLINTANETVYAYTDGGGLNKVGYPMNSLFNFRWAGLDPTNGTMMVYDKDGNVVRNYDESGTYVPNMMDVDGLVYSGPLQPAYTIGFTNTFNYKQLGLSVFLIANGGNVIRDAVPTLLSDNNIQQNTDRSVMNFWRQPGDENKPGVMPAPDLRSSGNAIFASMWYANDYNTLRADYIRIRDISAYYDLASLIAKGGRIPSARLMLQVQNPVAWFSNDRGLDPEAYSRSSISANRTLPVTPTYVLGFNMTF